MKFDIRAELFIAILAVFALSACSSAQPTAPGPFLPMALTPYHTPTRPAPPPSATPGATAIPLPTATLAAYAIASGDTLTAIAQRYNLALADLLRANPGLSPQGLSIGQVILLPAPTSIAPTPAPAPLNLSTVICQPSGGGQWCLVTAHNPGVVPLENILVRINLLDSTGNPLVGQTASAALNRLPPGGRLPLAAYFPAQAAPAGAVAEVQQAMNITTADSRYLEAILHSSQVETAWDGLSAHIAGALTLPENSPPARQVWLVVAGYDQTGQPVALRRWEWNGLWNPGVFLPFAINLYSLAKPIARVEIIVEARP